MAAGRHGGCYNEFRENEADFDAPKRGIPFTQGVYERLTNGKNRDYERGRNRALGGRVRGRVRQKDVKERELVNNTGYHSTSSRSDSGGSDGDGDVGHHEYHVGVKDREPGELSSESGSDEAIDLEVHCKNVEGTKIEELSHSHSPSKKRKFSPIVWDRDDKEVDNMSESRFSKTVTDLPLPPVTKSYSQSCNSIPPDVVQISSLEKKLQTSEHSPRNTLDVGSHDSFGFEPNVGLSSSAQEEHLVYVKATKQPEDDGYDSAHNIRSSRWANDADSPVDEGEISDSFGNNGIQRRRKMSSVFVPRGSGKQASSSEIGELHMEGSKGTKLPETYENGHLINSLSSDDYIEKDLARKDYMEIDEDHGHDDPSASQSDSESDDCSHGTPQHALPPQRNVDMLRGCRSVDEFERLNKIDEGTYGVVYRAKDKKTGEVVALKKVKMEKEKEGFPLTSLREINILLSFHHPSVVDVKEVVVGSNLDSIFMVMEYMEHDLKALMETMRQPFSQSEVKCLMLQLLEGTKYLHDNWVLHRDLKTSNLLLNNRGELKICDFGLSRQYGSPLKPYTHLVVTLWYRAPELLLGAKQYSTAIDMWSLGCIMAELLSKQPLFNGKTELDQLDKIFKTLGTPNEMIWPGFSKLPGVKLSFVKHQYNLLRKKFPATSFTGSPVLSDAGFDLLNKLLTYNPEKRITAEAALNHEWFHEVPLPKSKDFMPTFPAHHAQDRRTRRVMKSPDPLEELRRKELQQANSGTYGESHVVKAIGNTMISVAT